MEIKVTLEVGIKYSQGTPNQHVAPQDSNLWYRFDNLNRFSKRRFENFTELLVFLVCGQNRPISGSTLSANC